MVLGTGLLLLLGQLTFHPLVLYRKIHGNVRVRTPQLHRRTDLLHVAVERGQLRRKRAVRPNVNTRIESIRLPCLRLEA